MPWWGIMLSVTGAIVGAALILLIIVGILMMIELFKEMHND